MMEVIRRRLLMWLNVPSPIQQEVAASDLKVLMDRMDSLERIVMSNLQRPDEETGLIPSTTDQNLAQQPDAHLGAQ
jgi:hypothetical protein